MAEIDGKRFWNPVTETLSRKEIRALQEEKLRALVRVADEKSAFYRRKFKGAGIKPEAIKTLDDLRRLPLVEKEDHRLSQMEHPPYGDIHMVEVRDCIKLHGSGGTTGKPLLYLDTRRSWDWVADTWSYGLIAQGVKPGNIVLMPSGYNMFIGFWGAHYGVEKVGAVTLPGGAASTARRAEMIGEFGCSNFISTPSYALHMAAAAASLGIETKESTIRATHHAAEPGASIPSTKKRIEELWGADCYDNYGMVELGSISLFECGEKAGMHLIEDNYIAEVIDPDTKEPVAEGQVGEIVWTAIGARSFEVLPVIRYRSKDLAVFTEEPCRCGRTTKRLVGGIRGKLDDIKKVKGVNIFPPAIESVLAAISGLGHEWEALIERKRDLDELTIRAEVRQGLDGSRWPELTQQVARALGRSLLISCQVELCQPGEIAKKYADVLKPGWKRIIDKRDVPF